MMLHRRGRAPRAPSNGPRTTMQRVSSGNRHRVAPGVRSDWRAIIPVVASDAVACVIAVWIAYSFRFHLDPIHIPGGEIPAPNRYAAAAPVVAILVVAVFVFMDVYRVRRVTQSFTETFSFLRPTACTNVRG